MTNLAVYLSQLSTSWQTRPRQRNEACCHVPTRRERFMRWLGFTYHLGEEPKDQVDADKQTGWMHTDVRLNFGLLDRLRLLCTGKLRIRVVSHMDVQPTLISNRMDWHILPPGGK